MDAVRTGSVTSVSVAVLTFHRVHRLAHLLPLLKAQAADLEATFPGHRATVLVVDNDPGGSAGAVAAATAGVRYVVEPHPGISAARNRALAETTDHDLLAFIDDDETPRPGWLVSLVRTQHRYGAGAVSGPVVSVLTGDVDDFVVAGGFFDREHRRGLPTGARIRRAATNNLLLDLRRVRGAALRFDDRFGLTGGEDSVFTGRLEQTGASVVWCAEAVVDDHPSVDRLTREYVLTRTVALAASGLRSEMVLCDSAVDRTVLRARTLVRESVRLVQGAVLVVVGILRHSPRLHARGHRDLARGRGALRALGGHAPVVYGEHARSR